jgi:hypothetical protein
LPQGGNPKAINRKGKGMQADNSKNIGTFGRILANQLAASRIKAWRCIFFLALLLVALLNLVITNHHPHFGWDKYPFFWPIFGLLVGLIMVFLVKKIIQPFLKGPEDYYGDL